MPSQKTPQTPKIPGRNGFVYKPQFGVIVICQDEQDQADIYRQLREQDYRCKVVSV